MPWAATLHKLPRSSRQNMRQNMIRPWLSDPTARYCQRTGIARRLDVREPSCAVVRRSLLIKPRYHKVITVALRQLTNQNKHRKP